MDNLLKKIAIGIGLFLLSVSVFWSQDGFNFDLAGDAGGSDVAVVVGWGLAISVSVIQFVFSTNYKELNASLITFGVLAYIYSIYTNYQGILHFQGGDSNRVGAFVLGFVMDGVPEPLIAWGLGESLAGDFIGNVIKAMFGDKTPPKRPVYQSSQAKGQPSIKFVQPDFFSSLPKKPVQGRQGHQSRQHHRPPLTNRPHQPERLYTPYSNTDEEERG